MNPTEDLISAVSGLSSIGLAFGMAEGWIPARLLDGAPDAPYPGPHSSPQRRKARPITRLIEPE